MLASSTKVAKTTKTKTSNTTMASSTNMLLTKTSDTIKTTTRDNTIALRGTLATSLSSTIATRPVITTTATTVMPTKIKTNTTVMPTTTTTTITSDPGILCFHHCNVKVFCFHLPHRCPKCKQVLDTGDDVGGYGNENKGADGKDDGDGDGDVDGSSEEAIGVVNNTDVVHHTNERGSNGSKSTTDDRCRKGFGGVAGVVTSTRLLPFRLPYPFIRASQYPCAIVLRPTTGDFLNDYNNSTDLHIAVTTSTGCVVEFDRYGLRRHRANSNNTRMSDWWQCLLVGDVPEPWYDYWDDILQQIRNQQPDRWTIAHYQEDSHNCYTFVLAFLQELGYDKLSTAACSKTTFCEKYIVPRTTTAGKYISLYRKLRDTGIYVHPHYQHQRHSLLKQQQQQQLKHYHNIQQQHPSKQPRGKLSRINGHLNGGPTSALLANGGVGVGVGGKSNSIILRAPNLCTIEE